ncbi:MAG: ornithine cyclodeaminase family protein [Rhizomicrobium sp.]
MSIFLLSEAVVAGVLTRTLAFAAVREAFVASAAGDGEIFAVAQGRGNPEGSSFSLKSALVASRDIGGFKFGSYWPGNRARDIPAHASLTVLIDGQTGLPRAILNASRLNAFRTAAADAVATEALARPDAETLGLVGCGHQAEFEIRAILDIRPIKSIRLWNRTPDGAVRLRDALADLALEVAVVDEIEDALKSDIIITTTAARTALVRADAVRPGTHISAMGSDQPGKQELDIALVADAKLFADKPEQSIRIGEFQHAQARGLLRADAITAIGAVLAGTASGRTTPDEITIFDSSGIAMQDVLIAEAILQAAIASGTVRSIAF